MKQANEGRGKQELDEFEEKEWQELQKASRADGWYPKPRSTGLGEDVP